MLDEYVQDFIWTPEMEENARKIIEENAEIIEEDVLKETLHVQNKNWEKFYKFNKTNFFKDRHYILREFSELKDDERVNKQKLIIGRNYFVRYRMWSRELFLSFNRKEK